MVNVECEYDCPCCGAGWVMGDEGIYVDNVEDECVTTCDKCGGKFKLRCVSVEVEMETIKLG